MRSQWVTRDLISFISAGHHRMSVCPGSSNEPYGPFGDEKEEDRPHAIERTRMTVRIDVKKSKRNARTMGRKS
jgi:hypothetical protein